MDMTAEALDSFLRAAESDRSSYMALNSAGAVYLNHMKDYARAKDCFHRALELADLPLVRQNLTLAEHKMKETGAN
jgi:tetratricopeptide (TPR) repeat protein